MNNKLSKYRFADAGESLYLFIWNDLASSYLESMKGRKDKDVALNVLLYVFINSLKLLHPFMPFVTEAIWQELKLGELKIKGNHKYLILCGWPTTIMTN